MSPQSQGTLVFMIPKRLNVEEIGGVGQEGEGGMI